MITIEPFGGLANRMRVIASGIWLQQQLGIGLNVVWNINNELACPYADLFLPIAGVNIITKPFKYYRLRRSNQPDKFAAWKAKAINTLLGFDYCIHESDFHELIWAGKLDILQAAKTHKRIYIQTCQEFGDNLTAFKLFKPIPAILARIEKTVQLFGPHSIGVHIRRTDNEYSVKHSPLDLFITAMEGQVRKEPETNFYLCSDDEDTKAKLKSIFGARIITANQKADRLSAEGMQDALIDMYCLAATQGVLGSYWSSFSDIATRLNNIPLTVIKAEA
ncbi:O-fucosyltransferase family protein [Mucilaginibacter pedocola]|uniref:Glycosyl transferase family 11 n=1 Tax=Mucilaginibacter pedocola TaxID=1792845 RepID=A0A1S9PBT9_9SPHI|nr:hypothetical protein [Mucilaginibacter pedocola]OOQ58078.1 hypothetical protein BC343_10490 [Mucilaginibacter pedocola]